MSESGGEFDEAHWPNRAQDPILLFIQLGKGRPKCVLRFGANKSRALKYWEDLAQPQVRGCLTWLVECPDAEAGRTVIAAEDRALAEKNGWGRIIASGGKP